METEVKKHPDFPQWIKSKEGEDCMLWPISEPKYLQNRLFWAFDAGRNCVWHQYITQKDELASLREQLDEAKKLIMDIQASWQQLNELTPELEERISRLLLTSAK